MQIELVGVSAVEGGKGVFDRTAIAAGVVVTELKDVSNSVAQFCQEFLSALRNEKTKEGEFCLRSVEVNIELTLKGEVRLIAAASAETKGSIKLTFGPATKE